ncbi:MAG: hypothetical protein HDT39_00945 [Lachnospiraceae bacterium]|nr:hypothetical protein [Lachnospiraceae bacterium]
MRKVLKKAVCMLMACTIMLTPAVSVQAANVSDQPIGEREIKANVSYETLPRDKQNTTKVYVYFTKLPTKYITVQTLGSRNTSLWYNETKGTGSNPSAKVQLKVQSSITNFIYENRGASNTYVLAKLRFKSSASGTIKGVWSPDSTRNYTVVN